MSSWSYSRLSTFEECPARYKYQNIDRIPTPQHPAATRGTKIHDIAERYINGVIEDDDCPSVLRDFEEAFFDLREGHKAGTVVVEEDWAFDKDWMPAGWVADNTWGRYKLDACVTNGDRLTVIDFKTGRYAGNEKTHEAQCALYAVAASHKFPKAKHIKAERWYLDHNRIARHEYTQEQIAERKEEFTERALKLTTATEFPATPSENSCRWCYFGKEGICKEVYGD